MLVRLKHILDSYTDDELIILKQEKAIDMQKAIDFNFKVLQEKINQVIKVINNENI